MAFEAGQTMGTPCADIHDGPELVNAPPERSKIRRQLRGIHERKTREKPSDEVSAVSFYLTEESRYGC
jgi:hypothetical protein